MKNVTLLFGLMIAILMNAYSQETNELSKVLPIKKGEIILQDGTKINFQQLSVVNDTVVFRNAQMESFKYVSNDIYKISKTGNYAVEGAVYSGVGGLLGAVLGTQGWDEVEELKDKKGSFIVGATLVCTAIGGITGAMIKREKVIFKNTTTFSFQPGLGLDYHHDRMNLMLTCRIKINNK
jgi:hypothetical protein